MVFLSVGDIVEAEINVSFRDAVKRNHSATHILHATLKKFWEIMLVKEDR